jgi:hypothetical protein
MFWLDVLLSLSLPFVCVGALGVAMGVLMRRATLKPETLDKLQEREGVSGRSLPTTPRVHQHRNASGWESPLDAEIQRLKRKSMGL